MRLSEYFFACSIVRFVCSLSFSNVEMVFLNGKLSRHFESSLVNLGFNTLSIIPYFNFRISFSNETFEVSTVIIFFMRISRDLMILAFSRRNFAFSSSFNFRILFFVLKSFVSLSRNCVTLSKSAEILIWLKLIPRAFDVSPTAQPRQFHIIKIILRRLLIKIGSQSQHLQILLNDNSMLRVSLQ